VLAEILGPMIRGWRRGEELTYHAEGVIAGGVFDDNLFARTRFFEERRYFSTSWRRIKVLRKVW
jgi:hypothetical protein